MGKTARWFRSLFGAKKSSGSKASGGGSESRPANNNKKSSESGENIVKSFNENDGGSKESVDANKHAIAVAAATAAVAEAALAAAQAAAEVVRLTSGGSRYTYVSYGSDRRRQLAAVQIQSAFRAYLARRALKALKGLVKLQALVRGHIVRKQSTYMLQRMQAMARIQARACAHRAYMSDSSHSTSKSSQSHPELASHRTFDHLFRAYDTKNNGSALMRSGSKSSTKDSAGPERMHVGSNWLDHWMEENSWNIHRETSLKSRQADDEKSDKILEVDTWKPHINVSQGDKAFQGSQHKNSVWNHNEQIFTPFDSLSRYSTKSHRPNPGPSPEEHFLNMSSLKHSQEIDQAAVWAAENSPGVCSVLSRPGSSRRRGTFSPTRSECSRNFFSSYMGHPNYMANTESSRAKDRSQSAPRQRMDFNKPAPTKRFVRGYWDEETSSERGWPLHGNFRTRGYPGSGHSANLGISVRGDVMGPTNGGR